jgi:hypothetical protein
MSANEFHFDARGRLTPGPAPEGPALSLRSPPAGSEPPAATSLPSDASHGPTDFLRVPGTHEEEPSQ